MQAKRVAVVALICAAASPYVLSAARPAPRIIHVVDTVFVKQPPIDYDKLARRVAARLTNATATPTVIDGDLIVRGRLAVGGDLEPGTNYGITVRAPVSATLRLISNESLQDPQRAGNQHRHVGTLSMSQDGGLRLEQNSTCFTDERGCLTEDRARRRAFHGYDSMGDMAFYLSDVDSATGQPTAPRSQNLVFSLIGADGHIHINAFRPTQRIFFNGSTTLNAADLQWEVPLAPIAPIK